MTESGVTVHFPHGSDIQASMFSDVFAQIESKLDPSHSGAGIHDHSARVAAISIVDKGINATMQFVHSLLTRHNALVPISRLPAEILARVFHLLVVEDPPRGYSLGWIRVTHVCRHWRQVALDDSSLWAKIWGIPASTMWISEMLARAKNLLLDIEFIGVIMPETLPMILPQFSRTRRLCFHGPSTIHYHSGRIQEICSWEAPTLEHFELTAANPHFSTAFRDLGGDMLFKGHAPRLRTFSFSRVVIPWSLIPRGQLTQLKIARSSEGFDYPGGLNQLTDLLANCPALEFLVLESCLPFQLTEFPHGRTVHLSRLSRLRLRGPTSRIMNMLKMLKLPSSTSLHLDCISKITSVHNDSEGLLLPVISAHFQSPAPIDFKSLTVIIGESSLNITASTFPSTLRNRQTQNIKDDTVGNAEFVLLFKGLFNPGHSTNLLKQSCKMLPISSLEFISMSTTNVVDINWAELFSCCTNVITMEAIGRGACSLVRALTAPTVTNTGSTKEEKKRKHENRDTTMVQPITMAYADAAIFPKLKFLELTRMNFFKGIHWHTSGISFDIFKSGLQQRMAASGAPLKLLHISDCYISTEHANDLQKLVQDFRRDGNEDASEHDDYLKHEFEDVGDDEQRFYDPVGDGSDSDLEGPDGYSDE